MRLMIQRVQAAPDAPRAEARTTWLMVERIVFFELQKVRNSAFEGVDPSVRYEERDQGAYVEGVPLQFLEEHMSILYKSCPATQKAPMTDPSHQQS